MIIDAVSGHLARISAGHSEGWKAAGKLAVMGVITAAGVDRALSCARLVSGLGGKSSETVVTRISH